MEPGGFREAGAQDGRLEVAGATVRVVQRSASRGREHEVVVCPAGEVGRQLVDQRFGERHRTALVGLWRAKPKLAVCLHGGGDGVDATVEQVDRLGSQRDDLARSETGEPGARDQKSTLGEARAAVAPTASADRCVRHLIEGHGSVCAERRFPKGSSTRRRGGGRGRARRHCRYLSDSSVALIGHVDHNDPNREVNAGCRNQLPPV